MRKEQKKRKKENWEEKSRKKKLKSLRVCRVRSEVDGVVEIFVGHVTLQVSFKPFTISEGLISSRQTFLELFVENWKRMEEFEKKIFSLFAELSLVERPDKLSDSLSENFDSWARKVEEIFQIFFYVSQSFDGVGEMIFVDKSRQIKI